MASSLKSRIRKVFSAILGASLLMAFFQNCAKGGFEANGPADAKTNTTSTSGTTIIDPVDTIPTGPTPAEIEAARVARCKTYASAPTVQVNNGNALSLSMINGAGATSGNSSSSSAPMKILNKGITNTSGATTDNCAYDTRVSCAVDPSTIVLDQAFNTAGVDVAKISSTDKAAVINSVLGLNVNMNNSMVGCQYNTGSNNSYSATIDRTFYLANKTDNNPHRCVKASFKVNVTARNQINGSNDDETSSTVSFNVTINEGCWDETRLVRKASDGSNINYPALAGAGSNVAIDPNGVWSAVVTSRSVDNTYYNSGSVYLFKKLSSGWAFHSQIIPSGPVDGNGVRGVALNNGRLAISAYSSNSSGTAIGTGYVKIYDFNSSTNTWDFEQTLNPPTSFNSNDYTQQDFQKFGFSIAMNSSYIAVSAPYFSSTYFSLGTKNSSGAVYLFKNDGSNYGFLDVVESSTSRAGLGYSLAFDKAGANRIIVGAPTVKNYETNYAGHAAIYSIVSDKFSLDKTLNPTDADPGKRFGNAVALRGNRVAVGASFHSNADNSKTLVGAVYYFANYSSSTPTIKYGDDNENLGTAVELTANGLLTGGFNQFGNVSVKYYGIDSNTGGVSGTLGFLLFSLDRVSGDGFSSMMSFGSNMLIVGSYLKDSPNNDAGTAYVFDMPSNY